METTHYVINIHESLDSPQHQSSNQNGAPCDIRAASWIFISPVFAVVERACGWTLRPVRASNYASAHCKGKLQCSSPLLTPMFICFVSLSSILRKTLDFEPESSYLQLSYRESLFFDQPLSDLESTKLGPGYFIFYFLKHLSSPFKQWTMTLNSNKNEPAVILERVNSARTALSDLYLEQLLQNKPKSEKVRGFKTTHIYCHYSFLRLATLHCQMLTLWVSDDVQIDTVVWFRLVQPGLASASHNDAHNY